jgi:hypothetical protein
MATWSFMKILQGWDTKLTNGLNQIGQLVGEINAAVKIQGRTEGIGTTVGEINSEGVVTPPGMTAATVGSQGAVVMPLGATNNGLGTAALADADAFDPSGAADTAQANAESFATGAANNAESAANTYTNSAAANALALAQSFSSNAANITSGNLALGRMPSAGLSATIVTAKLTVGGANGSMTFTNGLLTAQTPAS